MKFITKDMRVSEPQGVKALILGKAGIGKTSLLWSLPPENTLFVDLEAGGLAVEGYDGDCVRPMSWQDCRNLAVIIGGPNTNLPQECAYSQAHYDAMVKKYSGMDMGKYEHVFIDSITVASRLCFQWCKTQPQAFSEKTGKPNPLGAYGLLGQEMIGWLSHIQHALTKNVYFVCLLDEKLDDFNRKVFSPQLEGSKTQNEIHGIVDEIITMADIRSDDGTSYRSFITQTINEYGYPAKDRSGRLNPIEEPHLLKLVAKCKQPLERKRDANITTTIPDFLKGE